MRFEGSTRGIAIKLISLLELLSFQYLLFIHTSFHATSISFPAQGHWGEEVQLLRLESIYPSSAILSSTSRSLLSSRISLLSDGSRNPVLISLVFGIPARITEFVRGPSRTLPEPQVRGQINSQARSQFTSEGFADCQHPIRQLTRLIPPSVLPCYHLARRFQSHL